MTHNYDFDSFMGSSKREETAQKLDTSNNHKAADTISRRNVRSGGNIGLWQKGKMDITFLSLVMILMSVGLICLFSSSPNTFLRFSYLSFEKSGYISL